MIHVRHYKNVRTDVKRRIELGLIQRQSEQRIVVVGDVVAGISA